MTLAEVEQYAAGLCYRSAGGNIHEAAAAFRTLVHDAKFIPPANCYEFVAYWGPRLDDSGKITSYGHRSGRHRQLSDDQARICYFEAIGWWLAGRQGPYESAAELIETNHKVRDIIAEAGVCGETMTRRMKEIDPDFHYGKPRPKPFLDEQHKEVRVAACVENLGRFKKAHPFIIFVDEKVLCLNDDKCMGWFSTKAEDYYYRAPPVKYGNKLGKLKYIIAVNYLLGPVWIKFFTGTSGMPAQRGGKHYQVSSALE